MLQAVKTFLYYDTVKVVQIRSWKLGLIHYSIMLGILIYVILFSIILEKGYQATDFPVGATMIKVKGVGYQVDAQGVQVVWDEHDVTIPALESNSIFLTTNAVSTPSQTRAFCDGNQR